MINHERCLELLHIVVNDICVASNTPEQIEELLRLGFEKDELIAEFGYSESDFDE